jgi:hypothetical protein
MEITREYQLKLIDDFLKKGNIKQHRLEKIAGLNTGTIRELRRGKRAMAADKWQKIYNIIGEKPTSEVTPSDQALIDVMKIVFAVLTGRKLCDDAYLEKALTFHFQDYQNKNLPDSMMVVSQLLEFVGGKPHQSEKEIIGRLLHMPPQGRA